jgi:hypothetical protein
MGQGRHHIEKYARAKGDDLTGVEDRALSPNLKRNSAAQDKSADKCPLCALSRDELLAHGLQPRGWLGSIFQKEEPVAPMAACTYHRQNGKRHALWHNNTPSLDFFANALAKNNVDCLVILWLENFAMVSVAAEKGMSRRSIFLLKGFSAHVTFQVA